MAYGSGSHTDNLPDEVVDSPCVICLQQGQHREAEKYCSQCEVGYCVPCVRIHDTVVATQHVMLNKEEFLMKLHPKQAQSGTGQSVTMETMERCDKHRDQYVDMYCHYHADVGCSMCIQDDHRSCQDVFLISDFIQDYTHNSDLNAVKQKLNSVSKNLELNNEIFRFEKEQLLQKKAKSVESIKKFRKEINEKLDEIEKNSIEEIQEKYNNLINEIEEGLKILNTCTATVASAKKKLESTGDASQNFVYSKKAEKIAKDASRCIEESTMHIKEVDIDFVRNEKIQALSEEVSTLGMVVQRSVRDTEVITINNLYSLNLRRFFAPGSAQVKENLLEVKRSGTNHIHLEELDEGCCEIVSGCVLKDGSIILSDYHNCRLKHLSNTTYTLTDHYDLGGKPWEVCTISLHEIAVCLSMSKKIKFLSSDTFTVTNKIKTDFNCWGLAHLKGYLYVTDFNTSVYIYSISGRKLKQFVVDQSGPKVFSAICSINVNSTATRFYITDAQNGLIVLDSDGQIVEKFNGSCMKGAHGSCLTPAGNLLVSAWISKNVLQFGPDGKLMGEVLKLNGSTYCKMVCCNHQMSKLIVGRTELEIEVYDLI